MYRFKVFQRASVAPTGGPVNREWNAREVTKPLVLTPAGTTESMSPSKSGRRQSAPVLMGLESGRTKEAAIGVLLVPEASRHSVSINRRTAASGLHVLRHADRIDFADTTIWAASDASIDIVKYDAKAHGERVYCFRSKGRLRPGEEVVICPGTPGKECGALYRRSAWKDGMACHGCGFNPNGPQWHPPAPPPASRLPELLKMARDGRQRGDNQ